MSTDFVCSTSVDESATATRTEVNSSTNVFHTHMHSHTDTGAMTDHFRLLSAPSSRQWLMADSWKCQLAVCCHVLHWKGRAIKNDPREKGAGEGRVMCTVSQESLRQLNGDILPRINA